MDINTVIVTPDTMVVTAIPEDKMSVFSPIFSACIMGRFPTGTDAMRHMASVAVGSNLSARIKNTIATGMMIIRIRM